MSVDISPDPAYVEANRGVVARVVARLGASRLLAAEPAALEPAACCAEAEKARDFLNMEITNVKHGGAVDDAFKLMRRSARDFVRAAGPGATRYADDPAYFEACLSAMRLTLGEELASLRTGFGVDARA